MTEGLIFEAIRSDHAEGFFRAFDFDDVYQFTSTPRPKRVEEVRARIKRFNQGPDPQLGQEWFNFAMLLGNRLDRPPPGNGIRAIGGDWVHAESEVLWEWLRDNRNAVAD